MGVIDSLSDNVLGGGIVIVIALTVLAFLVFLVLSFLNRDKLVIEKPVSSDSALAREFAPFNRIIESEIRKVSIQHLRSQEAVGDTSVFRELAPQVRADEVALKISPERFKRVLETAMAVSGWFLRPPAVRSLLYGDSATINVRATFHKRSEATAEIPVVSRSRSTGQVMDEMARELGLKVIIQQSPSIDINNWQALEHLTIAIERWPKSSIQAGQIDSLGMFKEIEEALLEASRLDPSSPLVNYNLGLLYYYRYKPDDNEEARKLFNQASRTPNARLKGLAKIGLARCFCQDYHRFGRETPAVLNEARELAGEAIALLERAKSEAGKKHAHLIKLDLARAYACRAFAYHVTEQPDDIEKGKADYLDVIDQTHPDVPTYVYNNLGYILMARAGRFTPADDKASYEEAKSYLEKALEKAPKHKFALANLDSLVKSLCRSN